ncbi:MAG: glycine--tRNA ligase subunit beta [delta proteobacterium MLS_D]|jgi:glycyl-tRNA synthetase beta chain|nr:MAG: glycine--tRNA ligase subunit beta [delta proteobacterium MLS_D]
MGKELLLEIGTEEIPAAFLPKTIRHIEEVLPRELSRLHIPHGTVKVMATPRRIFAAVSDLAERQEDRVEEKLGPAVRVAFDESGNPTKAAAGFARGQGLDVAQLERIVTDKGEYLAARKNIAGESTSFILASFLPGFILSIPFQKSMRWMDLDIRFARPIHWILAVFGGEAVSFRIGNIESGGTSRGHRFMSPGEFEAASLEEYLRETRERFVIVDPEERRLIIRREAARAAESAGGRVLDNTDLLEEVTYLVEYPSVICGGFDRAFLDLPREVLVTSMMKHQKYFAVVDDEGNLLPYFVTVNNTEPRNPAVVAAGNEKVLRARLTDARFFFEEDRKKPLEQGLEALKNVVFHSLMGTSYEKVMRFRKLAASITEKVNPELASTVDRAVLLCKADLETQMVYEFPELQGVMGREYALLQGEDPAVARAVYEHYLPVQAGGDLPESDIGAIVGIADKTDTITACFGVNLIPTGTADPYALRRQALGVINIILNKNWRLSLDDLVDQSLATMTSILKRPVEETRSDVLDFFRGRFENQLISQGHPYDVVDAVLSTGGNDLVDSAARIEAVEVFKNHPDFEPLVTAFKRIVNILKGFDGGTIDETLFESDAEKNLYETYRNIGGEAGTALDEDDYREALSLLARLRKPVDAFFESVLVMADDERIRSNRLALLADMAELFFRVADFSKLVTDH